MATNKQMLFERTINKQMFFERIRQTLFGGKLRQKQVDGITAILNEWQRRKLTDIRWLAYIFATVHKEVDGTFKPIREYGRGRGKRYGTRVKFNNQPYTEPHIYYGRGFPQLTWWDNYNIMTIRAKKQGLDYDFLNNPDLALQLEPSLFCLFEGMIYGLFTKRKLSHYINSAGADFENARKIINGLDAAKEIEAYANKYIGALQISTQ